MNTFKTKCAAPLTVIRLVDKANWKPFERSTLYPSRLMYPEFEDGRKMEIRIHQVSGFCAEGVILARDGEELGTTGPLEEFFTEYKVVVGNNTYIVDMRRICPHCNKDLTEATKICGRLGWKWHLNQHKIEEMHEAPMKEIVRLRKGLETLRDGGYGCSKEAQKILDGRK